MYEQNMLLRWSVQKQSQYFYNKELDQLTLIQTALFNRDSQQPILYNFMIILNKLKNDVILCYMHFYNGDFRR